MTYEEALHVVEVYLSARGFSREVDGEPLIYKDADARAALEHDVNELLNGEWTFHIDPHTRIFPWSHSFIAVTGGLITPEWFARNGQETSTYQTGHRLVRVQP